MKIISDILVFALTIAIIVLVYAFIWHPTWGLARILVTSIFTLFLITYLGKTAE